jgi:hypothetical protein
MARNRLFVRYVAAGQTRREDKRRRGHENMSSHLTARAAKAAIASAIAAACIGAATVSTLTMTAAPAAAAVTVTATVSIPLPPLHTGSGPDGNPWG